MYQNQINITSARRLNIPFPSDDRIIFRDVNDILTQLNSPNFRYTAWFNGLVAYVHELHSFYVWRLSDKISNNTHPSETNPNLNIDYTANLLPDDFQYPLGFPDSEYAGYWFNWYPLNGAGGNYVNYDPTSASNLEGWPVNTIPGIKTFQTMWDLLLYPYQPPLISLAGNPAAGFREKGIVINSVNLNATTVKKKLNITEVKWFRDNTLINTLSSPNPNGATETHIHLTPIGAGVNPPDVNFKATVADGQTVNNSNIISYKFVYPFYVGALTTTTPTESDVKGLTKLILPKQNISYEFNFTQKRYIFAYPQAYGILANILDTNLFETIDDYDIQVGNYTMLDGNVVPYFIYIFNSYNAGLLTDAVNFTNTFKF
jgi:hypothetical protein